MFFDTDFLKNDEICLQLVHASGADPVKGWVPAYYFNICLPDGTPVGKCDLRIGHNEKLYIGGNIGYSVDEPYRGHHYAEHACRLIIPLMQELNLKSICITANPDNIPSRKTCERIGCELESIVAIPQKYRFVCSGDTKKCRYILRIPEKA